MLANGTAGVSAVPFAFCAVQSKGCSMLVCAYDAAEAKHLSLLSRWSGWIVGRNRCAMPDRTNSDNEGAGRARRDGDEAFQH